MATDALPMQRRDAKTERIEITAATIKKMLIVKIYNIKNFILKEFSFINLIVKFPISKTNSVLGEE